MRKYSLLVLVLVCTFSLVLTSCKKKEESNNNNNENNNQNNNQNIPEHTHNYVDGVCSCGDEIEVNYTVTFKNYDGSLIKEEKVIKNGSAVAPDVPNRDGYDFVGWSESFDNVTKDLVIIAQYVESIFVYSLSETEDYYTLIGINDKYKEEIIIPSTHKNLPVKEIGASAFYGCGVLKNVIVPDSITKIGTSAFEGCFSLESITLPFVGEELNKEENSHFGYIFGALNVNANKDRVPTTLQTVVITNENSISKSAFYGCLNIVNITLPCTIKNLSSSAFKNCTGLQNVYFNGTINDWIDIKFEDLYASPMAYATNIKFIDENNEFVDVISVEIPYGIEEIGSYQFIGFNKMESIKLPNSIITIGESSFLFCSSLESLEIPNSVTSIGRSAFSGCASLTNVELPDSVTTVGNGAFANCTNLISIVIPSSVTTMGLELFSNDINLKTVSIPFISKQSSYNFSHLFSGSSTNNKELSVEEVIITGKCNIYESAFANWSNIKSIKLTGDINEIGVEAFRNCKSLTELIISPTVTKIGYGALISCNNIETLSIPGTFVIGGVTSAKNTYFGALYSEKNKADRITSQENVPTNIKEIIVTGEKCNDFLFNDCVNITNIKFADTITEIGGFSLSGCSGITNIVLSENLKKTAGYTFENCTSLKSITIPSSIEIIGDGTFKGCTGLTSIEIPNGVAKIERNTFQSCSNLTNIEIPNSVVEIGDSAFSGCTSLTNIKMPDSLTYIGASAFYSCRSLTNIEIPNSVITIGEYAFQYCTQLANINLSDNLVAIASDLFMSCTSLNNIEIPNSVSSIGPGAFSGCTNLISIVIPNSVVEIGKLAFYRCENLTKITLPFVGNKLNGDENTHFGYIFGAQDYTDCNNYIPTNLKEVVVTGSTVIKAWSFSECASLASIKLSNTITSIEEEAFSNCVGLTSFEIPDSVTSIGKFAFRYCNNIITVILPNSLSTIGISAFSQCFDLEEVYYKGTLEEWNKIKFETSISNPRYYAEKLYVLNSENEYYEVTE